MKHDLNAVPASANTPTERRQARATVAHHAHDADDLAQLLDTLALTHIDDEEETTR
ncbi:MAG: hypothetical protein ACRDQA_06740 [Nocardioidaceae bacterium]